MVIELIEIFDDRLGTLNGRHRMRTVYLNPEHVVSIYDSPETKQILSEGGLPEGISEHVSFSTVTVNKGTYGQEVVVVGAPSEVRDKLFLQKTLLKG